MTELAIGVSIGVALAAVFYGGQRLSALRPTISSDPATLAMSSFFVRIALTIAGFIWAASGQWQNAVACAAGFTGGRFCVVRWRPCAGSGRGSGKRRGTPTAQS
jgi:F1F0 ATPase subunit 2